MSTLELMMDVQLLEGRLALIAVNIDHRTLKL
jgi:hypothetical protein